MDYARMLRIVGTLTKAVASGARRLSWNLQRQTPHVIESDVAARVEQLKQAEIFALAGRQQHERVAGTLTNEWTPLRRLSASAARWLFEPQLQQLQQYYTDLIATSRRDVARSFLGALDGVTPDGMLTFHLLQESLRPSINSASAADLLARYERAMTTKDALGLIEATLIEERRREHGALATKADDLPIVKRLDDYIEEVEELRIPLEPAEREEIEATIEFGRKTLSMADLAQVRPINIEQPANTAAKAAYESEASAYKAAVEAQAELIAAAEGD